MSAYLQLVALQVRLQLGNTTELSLEVCAQRHPTSTNNQAPPATQRGNTHGFRGVQLWDNWELNNGGACQPRKVRLGVDSAKSAFRRTACSEI